MKQQSKRERFYSEVGEAISMSDSRSFINIETLEVDIHASEVYFSYGDMEDTAQEAINNPVKFLALEHILSSDAFRVMEAFIETVKNNHLQIRLKQALERKKPFANFKAIIDDSSERQNWFDFRDDTYAAIAKEWLENNVDEKLLEKIKALPVVYISQG
jgi:hypothetical protein